MASEQDLSVSKKGSASIEKLTTVTGTRVRYTKDPTCAYDVMQRGPEVTLTPGLTMVVGGRTGVATTCECKMLPGVFEEGAGTGYDVWETTATLEIEAASI